MLLTQPVSSLYNPNSVTSFYGLLEEGCEWGHVMYGNEMKVALQGTDSFIRKNQILLSSFGGAHAFSRQSNLIGTVAITEANLIKALSLYLYGQLFKHCAKVEVTVDDEGDYIDSVVTNDDELLAEANRLSILFHANHMQKAYGIVADYHVKSGAMDVYGIGGIRAESKTDYS